MLVPQVYVLYEKFLRTIVVSLDSPGKLAVSCVRKVQNYKVSPSQTRVRVPKESVTKTTMDSTDGRTYFE